MRDLRTRIARLEAERERLADQRGHCPRRRWLALNIYLRSRVGQDIAPWRQQLAAIPNDRPRSPALDDVTRSSMVLGLLCREARTDPAHRELLALAVQAGMASDRQIGWMRSAGLLDRGAPSA